LLVIITGLIETNGKWLCLSGERGQDHFKQAVNIYFTTEDEKNNQWL